MAVGLNDLLMGGKSITRGIGKGGPENLYFFWPARAILGPKTSIGREDDSDKGPR